MDKKEFELRNLNIGIKIMYKKQGTDLVFKQNYSRVFSEALKKLEARANKMNIDIPA